jgi:hypothetical protein
MKLPIAGIPYDQAEAVLARHHEELSQLPGVDSVSLGEEGIVVRTKHPEAVPAIIEGVRVLGELIPEGTIRRLIGGGWPVPVPTCTIERPTD